MENATIQGLENMLKDFAETAKKIQPEAQKQMLEALELMKKPTQQRQINIDGVDCMVQLYQDHVRIVLPNQIMAIKYYENFDKQNKLTFLQKLKWLFK